MLFLEAEGLNSSLWCLESVESISTGPPKPATKSNGISENLVGDGRTAGDDTMDRGKDRL